MSSTTAIRFGTAIRPLQASARLQTTPACNTAPTARAATCTTGKTAAIRAPNKYLHAWRPYQPHPSTVENANRHSATVKKIKYGSDGISLIPTNPAYDVQFYSAADVERLPVRVIGRVVELRAKY